MGWSQPKSAGLRTRNADGQVLARGQKSTAPAQAAGQRAGLPLPVRPVQAISGLGDALSHWGRQPASLSVSVH